MNWDEQYLRNITHDQLWKEVLWTFFRDFMEMFAGNAARELDFERIRRLDPEVFTDLPGGRKRVPDLVVEVYTHQGDSELVIIHLEVERRRKLDTPHRMWEYYALLRLRLGKPVYPIVVYLSRHGIGLKRETYEDTLFGELICSLQYLAVGLPDLPAQEYLQSRTALGAAMSAMMVSGEHDAAELTINALERIAESGLDEARQTLLAIVVGTYARLTVSDRDRVRGWFDRRGRSISMSKRVVTVFEKWGIEKGIEQGIEKGIEKGIEQGVAEGLMQGQRRLLLAQMRRRFGALSPDVEARIEAIRDADSLEDLALRVLDAQRLEDLGL